LIDQEIKTLEGQYQDARKQAQEWANTALRVEGALAYMRQLRGRFSGVTPLQTEKRSLNKPVGQGGDDEAPDNGAYQDQRLGQQSAQFVNGPVP
jgi:hypothetical protein